ncbi:MAG: energy transducer TonB [Acidobacteriia bacterium]|nr:energy transducer TonB [Terriglobia bacterium]
MALRVEVFPDGLAHNFTVQRSPGLGLVEKAVEALKQGRFSPGRKDGLPVPVAATIEVSFRL